MPDHAIAIANSDRHILALLQDFLGGEGYDVATYITDSTTHAQISATQPHLVVLDAGFYETAMGWPLLKLLQFDPTTQHIPVLVTSVDHRFIREKTASLQAVGYDVLELPAPMPDLLAKIVQLLAGARP